MKIAIVSPSPVPFTIGGAENLMWGLCESINKYTDHQAELIKLPTKEHSFWDLIESYYTFYKLDLSHFDLVISSKYPSWMVQHKNCVCYMMHTLRGLYDTYHLMNMPYEVERGCETVNCVLDYMETNAHPIGLDEFFALLFKMKVDAGAEKYCTFPGPLIRKIVHYMDKFALSRHAMKDLFAISDTVKKRKEYFPKDAKVTTIYPPTNMENATFGKYDYVFMISRLDAPKRIDMLIEAFKYVKSDIKLLIAGTGPEREHLEALAAGDDRIQFLGFVRDEDVEKYYANCLVVPYFPYDEDYGYITIEAMLHKKPVITSEDAGGPTEFVVDNESGFVVPFDAQKIAEKIDFFAQKREEAKRMGENGYNFVRTISWNAVVRQLLSEENACMKKRKKIVVTSTFAIYPPQGGGQARTYSLYKNLAKEYDVTIVSFDSVEGKMTRQEIAPGLIELRIPKSAVHQEKENELACMAEFVVTDIAMISLAKLTPDYKNSLSREIKESNVVILSHPYLYPEVAPFIDEQKIIYEAQDIEYLIKKEMLPDTDIKKQLLKDIQEVENACCIKSEFIMTCSQEDKEKLIALYNVNEEKVIVVPNGVDCAATKYTSYEERMLNKRRLGFENEKIALFMGSWHKPNLEACEYIFDIANKCPDTKFLLMGSQCMYFHDKNIPENVGLLGLVSEEEKNRIFSVVDFALNPMSSGSGTNLKMFDYMSAGIPIITTEFGTRGIDKKELFIIKDIEGMEQEIKKFVLEEVKDRIESARKYVEEVFDWAVISKNLTKQVDMYVH